MTRQRGITGFLVLVVSAALIQGCDSRTPLESASGVPLAASAPGTFPPPAPVGVIASFRVDSFAVELGWRHDGTQLASQWRVERRDALDSVWTQVAVDSGAGGRFVDASFAVGAARTLEYRVLVCNAAGCGTSLTAAAEVPALPPPHPLTATAGAQGITVAWEDPTPGDRVYQVLRRTASTAWSPRVTTTPGARSFLDRNVGAGQTYYYQVRALVPAAPPAVGRFRPTEPSQEASATPGGAGAGGPPVARSDSAVGTGASSATLYGAVTPNGRPTAVRFQWGTTPSLAGAPATPLDSVGTGFSPVAVSAVLTGLSAGTQYFYRVIASNAAGADSGAILPLRLGPPSAPRIQGAFVRPAYEVALSWSAPGAETYRVERRAPLDSAWTTLVNGYAQTSLADRGVPLDSVYRFEYRVTACNDLGCGASQTSVITAPLPVPSNVGAAVGQTQVQLSWNGAGAPAGVFFQVRRRTPGTPFRARVTTAPGSTSFTDAGVMADSTYLYQIRALLPTGDGAANRPSAWSGVLTVTPGVPGATPGVTTGPARFEGGNVVLTGTVDVRAPGTTAFFEISENPDLIPFTTHAASLPSGSTGPTPVAHTRPRPRRPLYYRLGARDGAGTVRGAIRAAVWAPAALVAPSGVQASFDGGSYGVDLRWAPVEGAEFYRVTRLDPGRTPRDLSAVAGFRDVGFALDSARVLTYVVRACSAAGCGDAADSVHVAVDALAAPGGMEAEAVDIDRVTVRWDDLSTGESGFFIERRNPGDPRFHRVAKVRVNGATSYTDTGLVPGATYAYRVLSYLDEENRQSPPSNVVQVTLPSDAASASAAPAP